MLPELNNNITIITMERKPLKYQEAYMKKIRLLDTMQTEKGTEAAVAHANCYRNWAITQDSFKEDEELQGQADACERFLDYNHAGAL